MRLLELKSQTRFLTHHACLHIAFNDVVVEWIDILFEDSAEIAYCPPHSHDWFEFNYVAKGNMRTAFGDGVMHTIEEGCYILIPPGMEHSHEYNPDSPHEGLCIRWRLDPRDQASGTNRNSDEIAIYDKLMRLSYGIPSPVKDDIGLANRLERLLAESEAGEQAIFVQLTFIRFLLRLSEAINDESVPRETFEGTDRLVRKVDIFLNDLQDRELNVKQLASSLHLSYAHVAREYKRRTGRTIVERMTEIRLKKSVDYLRGTDMTMREIAEKAGFASAYYFSRVFKREFGISPTQFRMNDIEPASPTSL
jgi:AraC-like DNA-binding protein